MTHFMFVVLKLQYFSIKTKLALEKFQFFIVLSILSLMSISNSMKRWGLQNITKKKWLLLLALISKNPSVDFFMTQFEIHSPWTPLLKQWKCFSSNWHNAGCKTEKTNAKKRTGKAAAWLWSVEEYLSC